MQETLLEKIVLGEKGLFQIGGGQTTQNKLYATLYSDVWKKTHHSFVDRYHLKSIFSSVSLCVKKYILLLIAHERRQKGPGLSLVIGRIFLFHWKLGRFFPHCCGMEDLHSDGSLTDCSCVTLYLH